MEKHDLDRKPDQKEKEHNKAPSYTGLGLLIGAGFGLIFGLFFENNFPIGIAIGAAFGLMFGAALEARRSDQ